MRGALALCLLITACAGRGTLVIDAEAPVAGTVIPILVASSRAATDGPELFAGSRSDGVSFLRFNVSVPPERSPGQVTFPMELPPSPQTDFYTVSALRLAGPQGFLAAVNAAVAEDRHGSRDASLFVHGYNTTFVEGRWISHFKCDTEVGCECLDGRAVAEALPRRGVEVPDHVFDVGICVVSEGWSCGEGRGGGGRWRSRSSRAAMGCAGRRSRRAGRWWR